MSFERIATPVAVAVVICCVATALVRAAVAVHPDERRALSPQERRATGRAFAKKEQTIRTTAHRRFPGDHWSQDDDFHNAAIGAVDNQLLANQAFDWLAFRNSDVPWLSEDPATGSANGCLAGYLAKYRYFGSSGVDVRVEQGYEIGRPSLLYLKAEEKDGKIDVSVGGKVVMVAKGELI